MGFWEQLQSAWVDLAWEPLEFIEAPEDRVLTPILSKQRGRESGVPLQIHSSPKTHEPWALEELAEALG
jgi:hypothetical protein